MKNNKVATIYLKCGQVFHATSREDFSRILEIEKGNVKGFRLFI